MAWRDRVVPERAGPLLAAGVLMGLAHPPFHLLVTSFLALVPMVVWLERLPRSADGNRQARIGGFFFGLVYYGLVFHWLLVALVFYTVVGGILAFMAPILILSMFMSWTLGAVHSVRSRLGWPIVLVFPVFWTANEWLRASLPQVGFPWMQLGDTLTNYPALIGAADLVGSRGLSLWLALANAVIAVAFLRYKAGGWRATRASALGLAATLVLPISYSVARWRTIETRPTATVGIVQPNVPQHIKINDRLASTDSARRSTETLIRPWLGDASLDLLLLPETALQLYFDPIPAESYPGWSEGEQWVTSLARRLESEVVVGALGAANHSATEWEPFNSAFHFRADEGRVAQYDKRFVVPMVERVPFIPPEWLSSIPFMGNFGVGAWGTPVELATDAGSASYGTMICYESIFSPLARHYRRQGADFLVNLTNDSWFGRDTWWSRSSALWQHPAHMVMRAIETRMGVARSANTGLSFVIDPLGRVSSRTELFSATAFIAEVRTTDIESVYVRLGDVSGAGAALAAILALCASIWKARREPNEGER